jgi:hypothetical protein
MNEITELEFFLNGFKPAFMSDANKEYKELKKYPFVKILGNNLLYFTNESKKELFRERLEFYKQKGGNYKFKLLGETFGYPPEAIEAFSSITVEDLKEGRTPKRFLIDYYGLSFIGYETTILNDLKWLEGQYKIPKSYKGCINIKSLDVLNEKEISIKYDELSAVEVLVERMVS